MKGKKIFTFFVFALAIMVIGLVSAQDPASEELKVKANILKTNVGIIVPDQVNFGSVAKGYASDDEGITVENIGTTNIELTPELKNQSEGIFKYLGLKRIQSETYSRIGSFDVRIDKPATVGGSREQNIYMQLDLTKYEGDIHENMLNHEAILIFTAMPI